MIELIKAQRVDGTNGGKVACSANYQYTQAVISGRNTGIINIKAMARGADIYEDFESPISIDLADNKRTVLIRDASLVGLFFTPGSAGDDFYVTVTQWKR